MLGDGDKPPLGLRLRFTWCRSGEHEFCPQTIGGATCTCDCHLAQAAA